MAVEWKLQIIKKALFLGLGMMGAADSTGHSGLKKTYWSHNNSFGGFKLHSVEFFCLPVQISRAKSFFNIFLWYSYGFDEHNQRHEKG